MNESIIRRLAKYHGVGLVVHEDAVRWALEEIAIALHGSVAPHFVLKVAQSITRIEDAEMLLDRGEEFTAPLLAESQEARRLREFYAFDADRLLVKAGVDPELWAKAKDEEA